MKRPDNGETYAFNADKDPLEYSVQDLDAHQITALEFAGGGNFVDILVLRLIQFEMRRFERLGIATCPTAWFIGADEQTISLV